MENLITFLDQQTAQKFDQDLMSEDIGFTLDILMELAGQAVADTIKLVDTQMVSQVPSFDRILVLVGPGNNGGDGIVSARHLKMMGYDVDLQLLREPTNPFFKRLLNTCKANQIPIAYDLQTLDRKQMIGVMNSYSLIVDALLGFSYVGPLREPYKSLIESFKSIKTPIISVDIPSGWDVEGNNNQKEFFPDYLISLTLPKLGVQGFKGRHFLGGRFVPITLQQKYGLSISKYEGSSNIQEITHLIK